MAEIFLVTGGAGFIGSHLVEELVNRGFSVRVLDNFSSGTKKNLQPFKSSIEIQKGEIGDPRDCLNATKGVTHVVHLAAQVSVIKSMEDPLVTEQTNVGGTLNLLEACRTQKVQSVLFASSCSIYGDNPKLPLLEDSLPKPLSPYAITKLVGEYYFDLYGRVHGLPCCSFRLFNVFGPRQDPTAQYAAVIPIFIDRLLRNREAVIFGDGRQTRDFVYVKDLVKAMIHASLHIRVFRGKVFNLASGIPIPILELYNIISRLAERNSPPTFDSGRSGEVRFSYGSSDSFRRKAAETGLFFTWTPFQTGLQSTIDHFQTRM